MRKFNIIAGAIVFICMLILSYSHTADLFARGGYHGRYAHIGVIACELLFFLSNTNITICRLKGWKVPVPIRLSSVVSALVVGYANVSSGFAYGWEGIGIGALILVVIVVSELVVSAAIISARADGNTTATTNTSTNDTRNTSTSESTTSGDNPTSETANFTRKTGDTRFTSTREDDTSANKTDTTTSKDTSSTSADDTTTDSTNVDNTGNTSTTITSNTTNTDDTRTGTSTTSNRTSATVTTINNNTSRTGTTRKTGTHLRLVEPDLEAVKKKALEIYQQEGELPGRPRLQKETGCKENHARRVLKELKAQIG